MSLRYLDITLTPTGRFFFGGEVIFGQQGDDERRRSYLVKSRVLPQQTSLLGMLRYELLRAHRALAPYASSTDQTAAEQLVGTTGFAVDTPVKAYGAIHGISPLLLHDGSTTWGSLPLDDGPYHWHRIQGRYWQLKGYDPKQGTTLRFGSGQQQTQRPLAKVFDEQSIVGNRISNRHYRGRGVAGNEDEGFFRQSFLRNVTSAYAQKTPSFAFTFRVAVDQSVLGADAGARFVEERRVTLGGERSQFLFQAKDVTEAVQTVDEPLAELLPELNYHHNIEPLTGYRRIVFQSDVFLPKDLLQGKDTFLLADPLTFRFLQSRLDERQASKNFNHRRDSKAYQLLQRGGVLIVPENDAASITHSINTLEPFRRIGYNYCTHV